jgi:putative isomerase
MLAHTRREMLRLSLKSAAALALAKTGLADPLFASTSSSKSNTTTPQDQAAGKELLAYFASIAPSLLRPAEGVLKYPSIAPSLPGKTYSTSLWDWDTYWTARGLFRVAEMTRNDALHTQLVEHARGSLFNFFASQSPEGRIPILLQVNNLDPFDCLRPGEGHTKNQAKPIMGQLALLIADQTKDVQWLAPHFDQLKRFYDSWLRSNQATCGLLVWSDDVAIGNDNDPATFGRPPFSSANLLLNCLFYEDLMSSAELARRLKRSEDAASLEATARKLADRMRALCWDPRDQYFYSVDVQCVDRRSELITHVAPGMAMSWSVLPIRIKMFTGFLPLWCGIADPQQAAALVNSSYRSSDELRSASGIRTLSNRETMYSLEKSSNPSNWLGPVWIISNYFTWKGLKRYGFNSEAEDLAQKTLRILSSDLKQTGSLNEYYHPDTGKPLSHQGFVDWNLLALEML